MKNRLSPFFIISYLLISVVGVFSSWLVRQTTAYKTFGTVLLAVSLAGVAVMTVEMVIFYIGRMRYVARMSKDIAATQWETLYNFPAPAFIIDEKNVIVWLNSRFDKEVFKEKEAFGARLDDLMDINFNKLFSKKGTMVTYKGRYYRALGVKSETNNSGLTMIYFKNETDYVNLDFEYRQSRPSVMIISVDDYEDLLENARDSEKAHILVEIEKLVENFIDGTTGVTKKISNNRFFVVLEERHLSKIIANRFEILDRARKIEIGERQKVTLSIGVGHGAKTLNESEIYARQALDMCLGRGGDQAAVKTQGGFEFFGGVSKGVEKRTKVKTRIIANAIKEIVKPSDMIFIMGHRLADLDSVGSAMGVCTLMRQIGKKSFVVIDPEENLSGVLIDHVNKNENETFFIPPELAMSMKTENTTLIIVDTHNPEILDSVELYKMFDKVIVIDHHRRMVKSIDNSVVFYHEPYASSASEMVTELVQYFGDNIKLSPSIAECLLAGIMLDTKNFVMRTGVRTFEAAAYLKQAGADTVTVRTMFSTSFDLYRRKTDLITNSVMYKSCAITITDDENSDTIRIAAPQAADELLYIDGVKASFVVYADNGKTSISARSMGEMNVQIVMESLGGGGHQTMAGGQLETGLDEAVQRLKGAIDKYYEDNKER